MDYGCCRCFLVLFTLLSFRWAVINRVFHQRKKRSNDTVLWLDNDIFPMLRFFLLRRFFCFDVFITIFFFVESKRTKTKSMLCFFRFKFVYLLYIFYLHSKYWSNSDFHPNHSQTNKKKTDHEKCFYTVLHTACSWHTVQCVRMCKRQHRKCIIFVKKIEKNRMFWWNACCIAGFWQQQKMKKKKYFISTERMTTKKRVWWHNVYAYIFFRSLVFHQNVRFRGNWIFIFNWFNVYLAKSLLFYAYNAFYFYLNEESTFFDFFQL